MTSWLLQLGDDQVASLSRDIEACAIAISRYIPDAQALIHSVSLPALSSQLSIVAQGLDHSVPGRKWEQISRFAQLTALKGSHWLEWCSGKGHLGRLLGALHQCPVVGAELQAELCAEGATLAHRAEVEMSFHCSDLLGEGGETLLNPSTHGVALHACGELHRQLLVQGVARKVQALSISPCCYHLYGGEDYRLLSRQGQASRLRLSRDELRLAVQETVTAGQRVKRLQQQELEFRLGFDELQRDVRGVDEYLAVPSIKKSLLGEGFAYFCRWAAERRQIVLPSSIDYIYFAQRGRARVANIRRLELVRSLFRRPLELWLVLDYALMLIESGYQVQLGTFTERSMTPRNILLHGWRS